LNAENDALSAQVGIQHGHLEPHQNTGTREINNSPAIDQLIAARVRGLARKRAIAAPKSQLI
jgi:hypothetical protein